MICCAQFPHLKSSATKLVDSVWSVMWHISLQILQTLFVCLIRLTAGNVVPVIKCTCTVFIDNFTNISIQVSICGESYEGYVKHKEMIQCANLGIPKGMKKCNFYRFLH